jgi:TrmH family RNA methyltransferase
VRGLATRKGRSRRGLFLVEGVRSAREALDGGDIHFAVCSPRARSVPGGPHVVERLEATGTDVSWVDDSDLEALAPTEVSQGILLVCRAPSASLAEFDRVGNPRLLLLDGLQDPGNVGTLIRSAWAFGLDGVVALDGTADPWSPKAVRAAAGGVFRTVVLTLSWEEVGGWLAAAGVPILASGAQGRPAERVEPGPRWALVVGSEARGVRPDILALARHTLAVPMPGGADSLNAAMAGTVLLHDLTRARSIAAG